MTKNKKTKIMVFGTFDFLHQGHKNFFLQARGLAKNPYLIVSVARDVNVKKIKKSAPVHHQNQRLDAIKKSRFADKCVLGGGKNYLTHIKKESPSIIALGYDQRAYVDNLKKDILKGKLHVKIRRLKAFKPKAFKSSLLKRKLFNKIVM